jgi:hypothetical protein
LENFYYEAIYALLQTPANHAAEAAKLKQLKAKITRLHHEEQKCLFLSNDDCDRLEGENPSLYHLLKTRKRQESKTVQKLHDEKGVPQTTRAGILKTFKNYMYEKFGNISTDNESLRGLLGYRHNTLPQDAAEAIDAPITMDELKRAMQKGKPNKAPGWDGISRDFFKTMWDTIKYELLEVVNEMYIDGQISDNQKHGMIVCVQKKPRPMRAEDYRHLTLLNADLKLLSRIIANRIRPWFATLLHPSQHCGIQGHNIFEAIAGVREAIAYTECTWLSLCLLSLDFKEAFDNISHDYLFQILEKYGFSLLIQQYIRGTYQNATSSIHINRHMTSKIPIKCSVRQGCPLSMLLFALCIDPFVSALASTLPGISVGSSGTHPAVLAYADDVMILLQSPSDVPQIQNILDQYGAAFGAKINIRKSKALGVGRWDTTVNIMGIQYHPSVKILGIQFMTMVRQSVLKSWSPVTDGICAHAREAYSRELNLDQCI